ncbi:MAG: FtsH-binding integral membrane protein [Pirellulaceae bacterium]|jgi:FtsH-binding integral membrane protein
MMETNVWDRRETNDQVISGNVYNLVIGLVLCWGFFVNYLMVQNIPADAAMTYGYWPFLIGFFASCMLGTYLFNSSDNPWVSFLGYNFVVFPFGLIINMAVSRYHPSIVQEAVLTTGAVTAVMMVFGTMFPAFFQKIAGALGVALISVIIIQIIAMVFFGTHPGILDWAIVLIFCGYIGFDWSRANQIPKTYDNAVDSAASLYMDIINLFLAILRILGRSRE